VPYFEHRGERIYYEDAGSGPAVLLLHGAFGEMGDLAAVRDALVADCRVISADTPGCGKSEPKPREFPPTYLYDDAEAFVALIGYLGVAPAHVVGFSDGGEYALVMAATRPEAVCSIVTWGAAGRLPGEPGSLDAFENVIDEPIPAMRQFSDGLKAIYGADNARVMVRTVTAAWKEIIAKGGDVSRSRAADITCPALLIAGENDRMCPPALVAGMAAAVAGGEYVELPGAGHSVHAQQPDVLIPLIAKWLAEH
jgi:valacyclovir hydrolase